MKYEVLFSDDAEEDVAELLAYLVPRARERVARRYVDRLIDSAIHLKTSRSEASVLISISIPTFGWSATGGVQRSLSGSPAIPC